jgi:hypothetical protein
MNGKRYIKVPILPESDEYAQILNKFVSDDVKDFLSRTTVKMFRVQNKSLQKLYDVQRELMYEIRGRGEIIEKFLWHGTHYSVVDSILNNGFDRNFSGTRHGTLYGKGNYYSNDFTFLSPTVQPHPTAISVCYCVRC